MNDAVRLDKHLDTNYMVRKCHKIWTNLAQLIWQKPWMKILIKVSHTVEGLGFSLDAM